MDTIIAGNYPTELLFFNAVLCSNDLLHCVENALASSYTGEYPIITGQDRYCQCKEPDCRQAGYVRIRDTRTLASQVVMMVDAVMQGGEAEVNDTKSYDNGTGVIPISLRAGCCHN